MKKRTRYFAILCLVIFFPMLLSAQYKTAIGNVLSTEINNINGNFTFQIKYFFNDSTYLIDPPTFHLPDNTQENYTSSGITLFLENDSIIKNFNFSYNIDSIPFYPVEIEVNYQSYFIINSNDTVFQTISNSAMVYFTPYNTIEIWSLSDFQDLPRRWFYEDDFENPTRKYIAKIDIPTSRITSINWDTIPLSEDWRDDYREIYIDGLAYSVLQPPIPPDSVSYYSKFGDYSDTTLAPPDPKYTYEGQVKGYLYSEIETDFSQTKLIPLSGIKVELRESDAYIFDQSFGETWTEDDGYFEINYSEPQNFELGDIELFLKIKSRSQDGYDIFSTNTVGSKYMHRVPPGLNVWIVGNEYTVTDVGDIIMVKNDHKYYDAFRAVHWAENGYKYFDSEGSTLEKRLRININWEISSSHYRHFGLIAPTIFLNKVDADKENVPYHEFGHHAMFRLQDNNFTFPWGTDWFYHSPSVENTSKLAWVEGWANFIGSVLDAYYYHEDNEYSNDGNDNYEFNEDYSGNSSANIINGFRSEYYFGCALYDLWDGPGKGLPYNMPHPTWNFHGWDDHDHQSEINNWDEKDYIELDFETMCLPLIHHPSGSGKIQNLQDYYQYLIGELGNNFNRISQVSRAFRENRVSWNAFEYNMDWSIANFSSDEYYIIEEYDEEPNGLLNNYTDENKVNFYNKETLNSYSFSAYYPNNPLTDNYWIGAWDDGPVIDRQTFCYFNASGSAFPNATFTTYGKNRFYIENGGAELGNGSGSLKANLIISGQSLFKVDKYGTLTVNSGSELRIKPDNSFLAKSGCEIEVYGNGKIVFEEGSYACFENGVNILLQDSESKIIFEDEVFMGLSSNIEEDIPHSGCLEPDDLTFTGNGEILYDCETYAEFTYDEVMHVIESNVTWSNKHYSFRKGIKVQTGNTFTLKDGSLLEFGSNAKIIVEPGATFIFDNSTLSNFTLCEKTWLGVEIWGSSEDHQYTINDICNQGKILLKNNPVIEHAINAILLGAVDKEDEYDDSKTGGIIQITDNENMGQYSATFLNNEVSINFRPYENFSPFNEGKHCNNLSFIEDCLFDADNHYLLNAWEGIHIWLNHVDGLSISGCDFSNNNTDISSPSGIGINGIGAGFDVYAKCYSTSIPCPVQDYNRCTFNNLYIGVSNRSSDPYTTTVKNSTFNNNSYGIQLTIVNNAAILFNDFNAGYNDKEAGVCSETTSYSYCIDMNMCTGFAIEENYFTVNAGAPSTSKYTGIRIAETNAADQVYKNEFENMDYGNIAMGKNWKNNFIYMGLAYYCINNITNGVDFHVDSNPINPTGIQSIQGSSSLATGNIFSSNADVHYANNGNHLVQYYYCNLHPDENPDDLKTYQLFEVGISIHNSCPSYHGGHDSDGRAGIGIVLDSGERLLVEQEFASSLLNYNNVELLYDNLKDGGNTEALVAEVETAWPTDMWELRAELLGNSPHLSMEVLKEASDKTDVLPESVLFEILSANPDELKKEELIKYLEDKENPLPDYMVAILRQLATGITYKTVLQQQMASYNQSKSRTANKIIRSIVADSIVDFEDLRNWLDNIGGIRSDHQIISTFLSENDFSNALSLGNMIPQLYHLEGDDLEDHNDYMYMLNLEITMKQSGQNFYMLDSLEIQNLVEISENENSLAAIMAKNILEFEYGYEFCNCPNLADTAGLKSSPANIGAISDLFRIKVSVEPNPASVWTSFNYNLPDNNCEAIIKIADISGRLIDIFTVKGEQGQKIWDTRKIKPGVYFFTFEAKGIIESGKIVIGN